MATQNPTIERGRKLRARREAIGATRDEVATLGGCSAALLQKVEDGSRRCSNDLYTRLWSALDKLAADRLRGIAATMEATGGE